MTDIELVQYVDHHSRTERALFHSSQLKEFFKIVGRPCNIEMDGFYQFEYSYAKPHIEKAYAVMRALADEATSPD